MLEQTAKYFTVFASSMIKFIEAAQWYCLRLNLAGNLYFYHIRDDDQRTDLFTAGGNVKSGSLTGYSEKRSDFLHLETAASLPFGVSMVLLE